MHEDVILDVSAFIRWFLFSKNFSDEDLFSIMASICGLVDSIPEHELIALPCGTELLLKRAQRCVHLSRNSSQYLILSDV